MHPNVHHRQPLTFTTRSGRILDAKRQREIRRKPSNQKPLLGALSPMLVGLSVVFAGAAMAQTDVNSRMLREAANKLLTIQEWAPQLADSEADWVSTRAQDLLKVGPSPIAEREIARVLSYNHGESFTVEGIAYCRGRAMIPFLRRLAARHEPARNPRFKFKWLHGEQWQGQKVYLKEMILRIENDNLHGRYPERGPEVDSQRLSVFCSKDLAESRARLSGRTPIEGKLIQ